MYNVKIIPRKPGDENTLVSIKSLDTLKRSVSEEGSFLVLESNEDSFIAVMRCEVLSVQATKVSEVAVELHPTVGIDQYVTDPIVKAQVDAAYNATSTFRDEAKLINTLNEVIANEHIQPTNLPLAVLKANWQVQAEENTMLNPKGC